MCSFYYISFTASNNEIIGVLGPNGAGKTTLLRMIAGMMKPTSGKVYIDDMNYDQNEIEIKKAKPFIEPALLFSFVHTIRRTCRILHRFDHSSQWQTLFSTVRSLRSIVLFFSVRLL